MTGDRTNAAPDAASGRTAGEAALIVTFYGPRDGEPMRLLHERLYRLLAQTSGNDPAPWDWHGPSGKAFLRRFDPPAAHDTTAVQLALNAPGAAASAWESARRRLEELLAAPDVLGAWWGYTVTYQAVTSPGVDADSASEELLPALRRPGSSEVLWPLAQAGIPGGKAWLLDIPTWDNGLAATVYLALGPAEEEEALVRAVYGPGAPLLMPDLIAHKGYHQMRQYRTGDLQRRYADSLAAFEKATDELLRGLQKGFVETDALEGLVGAYSRLVDVVARLEELRISMVRQSHNYDAWRTRFEHNTIIEFHRGHLETAKVELELMIAEGRNALGTANTAMSMARVEIDREQARRQRRIGTLLAVVGVGLAVAGIINQEVAETLLARLPYVNQVSKDVFAQLAVQVVAVIVFAALTALVTHLIGKRRNDRKRSGANSL